MNFEVGKIYVRFSDKPSQPTRFRMPIDDKASGLDGPWVVVGWDADGRCSKRAWHRLEFTSADRLATELDTALVGISWQELVDRLNWIASPDWKEPVIRYQPPDVLC